MQAKYLFNNIRSLLRVEVGTSAVFIKRRGMISEFPDLSFVGWIPIM
jgi:hypothetical protein